MRKRRWPLLHLWYPLPKFLSSEWSSRAKFRADRERRNRNGMEAKHPPARLSVRPRARLGMQVSHRRAARRQWGADTHSRQGAQVGSQWRMGGRGGRQRSVAADTGRYVSWWPASRQHRVRSRWTHAPPPEHCAAVTLGSIAQWY